MKKLLIIIAIFAIFSCSKKMQDDPIILPPSFAEAPDPKNPEKVSSEQKEENVARLKEMLLKSDE